MKRCNLFALCVSSMILALGVAVLSGCDGEKENLDKDKNKESGQNSGGNGNQQNDDDIVYPVVKQKEFIEDAAIDLLNLFPAQNFESQISLGQDIQKICDTYRWDNVEGWADDALKTCQTLLTQYSEKTGESFSYYNNGYQSYGVKNIYYVNTSIYYSFYQFFLFLQQSFFILLIFLLSPLVYMFYLLYKNISFKIFFDIFLIILKERKVMIYERNCSTS